MNGHADKRPSKLSGGQRQRVALARTLMDDKPVILFDEPVSALDSKTRADTQDLAAGMLQGRTALLVTHDPTESACPGFSIKILTSGGLTDISAPPDTIPLPYGAPNVFTAQADLLDRLRRD